MCWNPSCDERGNLRTLVSDTLGASDYEVARLLVKLSDDKVSAKERLSRARKTGTPFPSFPIEIINRMHDDLMAGGPGLDYMHDRGFTDETMNRYLVGYSSQKHMIATPMFDVSGNPLGVIGRGVADKVFNNSVDLPKNRTLWNIHNAKRYDTIVVCEANFDAMRISQAGYPNVVATLGGSFSEEHIEQLERYATTIVIMTDNDKHLDYVVENCRRCERAGYSFCRGHNPGRKLGEHIARQMRDRGKIVRWAVWSESEIYPHGAKDAGDMTDEEIRHCIEYAESNFRYAQRMKDVVV